MANTFIPAADVGRHFLESALKASGGDREIAALALLSISRSLMNSNIGIDLSDEDRHSEKLSNDPNGRL